MGKSVALELVKTSPGNGKYGRSTPFPFCANRTLKLVLIDDLRPYTAALPSWGNWSADASSSFARTFAAKSFFGGEAQRSGSSSIFFPRDCCSPFCSQPALLPKSLPSSNTSPQASTTTSFRTSFPSFVTSSTVVQRRSSSPLRCVSPLSSYRPKLTLPLQPDFSILHHVITLPIRLFTEASIAIGQEVWTWLADARPELEPRVVAEVLEAWAGTVEKEQGLFSRILEYVPRFFPVPL
jgi:phosphatidylinositol 4-kinase